ncbi:MAG: hypothetical protein WCS87_17945, partial [Methylococcaceae bacterium]
MKAVNFRLSMTVFRKNRLRKHQRQKALFLRALRVFVVMIFKTRTECRKHLFSLTLEKPYSGLRLLKGAVNKDFFSQKTPRTKSFISSCPSCLRGDNFLRLVQGAGNAYSRLRSKSLIPAYA